MDFIRILLGVSPSPNRTLRGLPKGKPLILAFYFPLGKETGDPQGLGVLALLSFLLNPRAIGRGRRPLSPTAGRPHGGRLGPQAKSAPYQKLIKKYYLNKYFFSKNYSGTFPIK